jgi:hypothetical protein
MTKNRSAIIWGGALLLVLSVLACSFSGEVDFGDSAATSESGGGSAGEATSTSTTKVPEPAEATEPPAPTDAPSPSEPPATEAPKTTTAPATEAPPIDIPEGEDPLETADIPELEDSSLDPRGEGLGHVPTFRQHMRASFTEEGSDYTSVFDYDTEVNTGDQALHAIISAEGAAAMELPSNTVEVIWIGTEMWGKIGKQPWVPVPEGVEALPFTEQALAIGDMLPYVQHFDKVDDRTMNDIPCAYYTYDAENVPTKYGYVNGQGDICVALDGGYVVHYTLDGNGTFTEEDFFQGSGAIQLVYDVDGVGDPIDIKPPRGR